VLVAVGNGITELEKFYSNLSFSNPLSDSQRFFPFIRQFPVGDHMVRFSYQAYLTRPSAASHSKAIFLAKAEQGQAQESGCQIVVKFVQRYNSKAHRLLAAARRAPELLYCSNEDANSPDLGGLIMVAMAHVDGKNAHERYGSNKPPLSVFNQIQEAVGILHTNNIVFADLRLPNIMVTPDEHVMLVDFDWCGVHEEGIYPITLNDDRDSGICWHPNVKRGGKMLKEHDLYRLKLIGALSSDIT
jgi:hypothetical protein